MNYYFYIIYSPQLDKYYLGHCSDIEECLRRHNTHHKGFTGKVNDWNVVYTEEYKTKTEAYSREMQVKKWKNRVRIEQMIKGYSEHPD